MARASTSFLAMRPYIVQILKSYGSPINSNYASVILGLTGICGTITCVVTVKFVGKRRLYLISLSGVCMSGLALGKYRSQIRFKFKYQF